MALCAEAGVRSMIAHHYGMFAFNTVDPAAIDSALAASPVHALRANACGLDFAFELAYAT